MIRLMIVDDHPLIRLGLHQILDPIEDIEIAAEADSGVQALRLLEQQSFDLIVLDMAMPGRSGVEILRRICDDKLAPPVLIYSRFPADQYAERTLRAGAAGYVVKSAAPNELVHAIRSLAAGRRHLPPGMPPGTGSAGGRARHSQLSEREFEVLRLIVGGHSVTAIANALSLSIKTVSTHRTRILRKLALTSTADLVHYAIEHGIDDHSA